MNSDTIKTLLETSAGKFLSEHGLKFHRNTGIDYTFEDKIQMTVFVNDRVLQSPPFPIGTDFKSFYGEMCNFAKFVLETKTGDRTNQPEIPERTFTFE